MIFLIGKYLRMKIKQTNELDRWLGHNWVFMPRRKKRKFSIPEAGVCLAYFSVSEQGAERKKELEKSQGGEQYLFCLHQKSRWMDSPYYSYQQQNNCIKVTEFSLFQHLAYSPLHLLLFYILTILGEVLVFIPALQMIEWKH